MYTNLALATEPPATMLIAEDDALIRALITRLITTLHGVPLAVADGAAAVAAVIATARH